MSIISQINGDKIRAESVENGSITEESLNQSLKNKVNAKIDGNNAYLSSKIYGVKFYGADPQGTRTDDAVGLEVNAGVDDQIVRNDFDKIVEDLGLFERVKDGEDYFIKIPKFYVERTRGTDTTGEYDWYRFSMTKYKGFNLPYAFIKPDGTEYNALYLSCYRAGVSDDGTYITSRPTIVNIDETNDIAEIHYPMACGSDGSTWNGKSFSWHIDTYEDKAQVNGYHVESYAEYKAYNFLMNVILANRNEQKFNTGVSGIESIYPYYRSTNTTMSTNTNIPSTFPNAFTIIIDGNITGTFKKGQMCSFCNNDNGRFINARIIKSSEFNSTLNYTTIVFYKNGASDTGVTTWATSDRLISNMHINGLCDNVVANIGSETSRTDSKHHFHYWHREDNYACCHDNKSLVFRYKDLYISNDWTQVKNNYRNISNIKYKKAINDISFASGWATDTISMSGFAELSFPNKTGGSNSKYYCDYIWSSTTTTSYHSVCCGGSYWDWGNCGSSCINNAYRLEIVWFAYGSRLSATAKLGN